MTLNQTPRPGGRVEKRNRQPLGRTEELREKVYTGQREVYKPSLPPAGKKKHKAVWAFCLVLNLAALAALGVLMAPQLLGLRYTSLPNYAFADGTILRLDEDAYGRYRAEREQGAQYSGCFYPGISIDGVDIGGMTLEEARETVGREPAQGGGEFALRITIAGSTWQLDSNMVPMTRNLDEMLTRAWAIGRRNTTSLRGTDVTPYRERLDAQEEAASRKASFITTLSWDTDYIHAYCQQMAEAINVEAVNASVAGFDVPSRTFSFYDDRSGIYIDAEEIFAQVMDRLDSGDCYASIAMEPEVVFAAITKADLVHSFRMISSYSTKTTSNKNRNTNISLSAQAINGVVVRPVETFSFNQTTGERTLRKGYKEATAISGGSTREEVGGGVCQTSSTLFNAVARADFEIVDRSPHAWPSSYVEKGMDATVNWTGLDFKWRNNTQWPVYIVAYYENRKVTVELYGCSLGDGITIDLESKVVQTVKAPEGIKRVQNPELPAGTSVTTVKARKGYIVETWQIWYKDGQEFKRSLLCNSTYKAYQETVEWN